MPAMDICTMIPDGEDSPLPAIGGAASDDKIDDKYFDGSKHGKFILSDDTEVEGEERYSSGSESDEDDDDVLDDEDEDDDDDDDDDDDEDEDDDDDNDDDDDDKSSDHAAHHEILEPISHLAIQTSRQWKADYDIKVRFLDDVPQWQGLVKKYAKVWEKEANIRFQFVTSGRADVRITFRAGGNWSQIGKNALRVTNQKNATMNLALSSSLHSSEIRRHILHEFGHVLGCVHEHSSPRSKVPWDKKAVYDYYKKHFKWNKQQVNDYVLTKYKDDVVTQFTAFDPKSIMLFNIPAKLTKNRRAIGGGSSVLSKTDKQYIRRVYPFGPRKPPQNTPKPTGGD